MDAQLQLTQHYAVREFLQVARAELMQDEVGNNLMLGLALGMPEGANGAANALGHSPYLATVSADGRLVAAALMTPPFNLVLHAAPDIERAQIDAALRPIAQQLRTQQWTVTGAVGRTAVADAFRDIWLEDAALTLRHTTCERIYRLDQVIAPPWPAGAFRAANSANVETLAEWAGAFSREALQEPASAQQMRDWIQVGIANERLFVWQVEGQLVSLAARSRPTLKGIAVNLVYTPPAQRGRGYASACVARLSQHLLDSGFQFCMLFTDLANPTSNSIYQKIGYRPVCDYAEHKFGPRG